MLLLTVALMGTATFLVGCLPTYDDIGIWAPVLLVALRLLQGFSASGEQSGANSLSLEHAPDHRRAFFTSFTLGGTQAGLVIATAVFLPIGAMPEDQLLSWGWRIPFWLSAIVVLVGLHHPPPDRRAAGVPGETRARRDRSRPGRRAAARPLARRPARRARRARARRSARSSPSTRSRSRSTRNGLDQTTMLWVAIVTNVVALAAIPLWAMLADRIGRKPVFIFGAVGSGALMFAYLGGDLQRRLPADLPRRDPMSGIVYSAMNGIQPSLYGEMFPTRVRLSGMAIGTQIGYAIGGFAPTAATAIAGDGPDGWVPVAVYVLVVGLIAAAAVATARETFRKPLAEIDGLRTPRPPPRPRER